VGAVGQKTFLPTAKMTGTDKTRFAHHSLIVVEALALGWLIATEDLAPAGLLLIGVIAAVALFVISSTKWPFGALSVLAVSSVMPRFTETLFGLHVRPEHLGIGFVVVAVFLQALGTHTRTGRHLQRFDYYLIIYILLNFLTSAVTSPEPRMTMRWAVLNAIVIAPYFLLRLLVKDESSLYKAFHILLWVGATESAYGTLCFLCNRLFNTTLGVEVGQYGAIPGVYGTQYEANLFGSYAGCCALMFLVLFFLSEKPRSRYGWGFLITVLGAAVSLSRAVMLAFPVVALVVAWVALRRGRLQVRTVVPVAAALAVLLLMVSPFLVGFVRERFSTIDVGELTADNTTAGRIIQMAVAVEDVRVHPILGTGTASFQLVFNWGDYIGEDSAGWVGNTPLRILHDTGFVGLTVFLIFIGLLAIAARRAIRVAEPRTAAILIALEIGLLFYAITFQSTEASLLAFTWVHVGCLAAAVTITQSGRSRS
jgi:O-antigen ligase